MKKLLIIFIGIIIVLFIGMCIMIGINNGYINRLEEDIYKNTDISNIEYVNDYNGYYIVKNNEYIYLFNTDYEEITRIKSNLVYDNKNNYDIVYRDKTIMYMDNYKNEEGIIFKYYDIYTYEEVDKVIIGGY